MRITHKHTRFIAVIRLALLSTLISSATAQVAVEPQPGALIGGSHGHYARFRQASPAFGPINSVDDAATLLAYPLPNPNVAFEAFDNGVAIINYTDTNTSPRPQQVFGADRDIRSVPGALFGAGDQDNYAAQFSGYIYIPQAGNWNFTVNSDEGFGLRMGVANLVVLESPGLKLPSNVTGAVAVPSPGFYHYELTWFERTGRSEIEFSASGPGQPANKLVGDASSTLQVFQTLRPLDVLDLGIQVVSPTQMLLAWTNSVVGLEEAFSLPPTNGWEPSALLPSWQGTYFAVSLPNFGTSRFFRLRNTLPPDPATVAPPVDPTVATSIDTATEFLYTGPNPIQTGVTNGTIAPNRVAVLRGHVTQRNSASVAGVSISVLNHPEFGQTLTRADGMFDLAVNGGGQLTVRYEKAGFISAQRAVLAPWRDYIWLPDVVMVEFDTSVTSIDLSLGVMQTARGSPVSDADGARRATILVPVGTTAEIVLPDGSLQALSTLHIRATEYTVGSNGPAAMPAPLPPSSAYTYAVELSADEALAAGATEVRFSRALPFYVENFVGFPVGTAVPTGYYDRQKGQWIASPNGRVIKVLGINNGLADLDLDGNGVADGAAALAALGVTDAERTRLAQLYSSGQTLWRVPITHFTPCDCNWPGVAGNAVAPPDPNEDDPPDDDQDEDCGSIIKVEDQTLGEIIPIAGTSWELHYSSDRTPGRRDAYTLRIPVSGNTIPASLRVMRVEVSIAGRTYASTFAPTPNLTHTITWDGYDGYGRLLSGRQAASIVVTYDYQAQYYAVSSDAAASFARAEAAGALVTAQRTNSLIPISKRWGEWVGPWDAQSRGLGGWSLSVHHAYDPYSQRLLLGDGRQRRAEALPPIINTVAGNGNPLFNPSGLAAGPEGSILIADWANSRVWRLSTDGTITALAGNGTAVYSGDGGPAIAAGVIPWHLATGPDGSLFIREDYRVRRVGADGIITTVAGNGTSGFSGDGGPATSARLQARGDIAVGPDGSLYMAESYRVRRVGPDGIITTVAGTGIQGFGSDGGPAIATQLGGARSVAVGPDGSLYIADVLFQGGPFYIRVRRVSPSGIITTVAGNGIGNPTPSSTGDGGPAVAASLGIPNDIVVASDGTLFLAEGRIRRVGPDGTITTVAGKNLGPDATDGGPATAGVVQASILALGADGSLYLAGSHTIRHLQSAMPGIATSEIVLPSEDGREVYYFSSSGRHLRTLDALTGALRYQFAYDVRGYLNSITDASGNVTTIERSSPAPTAIIAPFGQRTSLAVDGNGWLAGVTNPAAEAYSMTYSSDGLLQGFRDPRLNLHQLAYDSLGRLTNDASPAGGSITLSRTEQTNGYTVTTTSALSRRRVYQVEQLSTGAVRRTVTQADGVKTVTVIGTDSSRQITNADGSVITANYGPDPRWGMLAPVPAVVTRQNPGGLTETEVTSRAVSLSDPADLLSLKSLTERISVNGRNFTNVYDGATRTITSTSAAGRQSTMGLDALGRVVQSQTAVLLPNTLAYDTRGRLASVTRGSGADARTNTFSYNASGYLDTVTDPMGRTNSRAYDPAGRIITQTLPDGRTLAYGYDANGNLTSLVPPGRPAHQFSYTPVDLETEYIAPDLGAGSNHTAYTYDPDNLLTRITRPDQQLLDFGYDTGGACTCGRLSSLTLPTAVIGYGYDPTTGNLTGITNPSGGTINYAYSGALLSQTTWTGPVAGSVGRAYDNDFRLSSLTVNGTAPVAYLYDDDSLMVGAGSLILARDPRNGLLTGTTLGTFADAWSYDGFAQLTNYSASYGGSEVFRLQFECDKLGRITTKVETVQGVTSTFDYRFDLAGRLAEVRKDGTVTASYTFDSNGNRLAGPNLGVPPVYDNQDRLLQYGANAYSYTANGELNAKTNGALVTRYDYDVLGNLKHVGLPIAANIDYVVDGQNRRIGKKLNGTPVQGFLYQDGLKPIAELDGANQVVSRFIYATGVNMPDYMVREGASYRIITDHLGSPRLVLDTMNGTVAQRMDYDEYGNVTSDTNPGFQPFGFAGGLYDQDTHLVRFGARDYDPETGRWTTKDPIRFDGGQANLYAYVDSDPVNRLDVNGLGDQCTKKKKKKKKTKPLPKQKPPPMYDDDDLTPLPHTYIPPGETTPVNEEPFPYAGMPSG